MLSRVWYGVVNVLEVGYKRHEAEYLPDVDDVIPAPHSNVVSLRLLLVVLRGWGWVPRASSLWYWLEKLESDAWHAHSCVCHQ